MPISSVFAPLLKSCFFGFYVNGVTLADGMGMDGLHYAKTRGRKEALTSLLPREYNSNNKSDRKGTDPMKPIIGILGEVDEKRTITMQDTYIKAIEQSGGIPLIFPYVVNKETMEQMVSLCDGLLFSGGADIDPKYYGEAIKETCGAIQEHRDALEWLAFSVAVAAKKPILAICRGIQLVNVALGGTLYQDIPSEIETPIFHRQKEPKFDRSHEVNVVENTPLHELTGTLRIPANSFHHQAIKDLGAGLAVMATADDGIIEAVYSLSEPYLRAYQWHPERLYGSDPYSNRIIEDFVAACKAV